MQRVSRCFAMIVRQDLNAAEVHVANGVEHLVSGGFIGESQSFRIADARRIKDHGVGQRTAPDQAL